MKFQYLVALRVGLRIPALLGFAIIDVLALSVRPAQMPKPSANHTVIAPEMAMYPRMKIEAETPVGTITITAIDNFTRSYTWEGATRTATLWPRCERWYGSLGLYYPRPGQHWENHNGIVRGVLEEGQQHFKTTEEAMKWFTRWKYMKYVFRNDGLVVGWKKVPSRKQLNVEVWQFYVNGKRPRNLPGSQDDQIKTTVAALTQ